METVEKSVSIKGGIIRETWEVREFCRRSENLEVFEDFDCGEMISS